MLILMRGGMFFLCFSSRRTEKSNDVKVYGLVDSQQYVQQTEKVGRHGRAFPIAVATYHITDICKATEEMLLAGKQNEMKNLFTSSSSKRVRQLPETHQGTTEAGLQKMQCGLGLKEEIPLQS